MNWTAQVAILMGSDSDLPKMESARVVLDELGISHVTQILSAHRTPDELKDFIQTAESKGVQVFIAGAGGAAHLAGVVASQTAFPVIGVPISYGALKGQDALLSTAQMPPGIPVAAMAIDGSRNAGIFAAQILSVGDIQIVKKLVQFRKKMREKVLAKNENLL